MSHDIKAFLTNDGSELFSDAVKLTEVDAKSDPETEPYRSLYKARDVWKSLKSKVESLWNAESSNPVNTTYLFAALDLKLGLNYIETEEKTTGEEHLKQCLTRLESNKSDTKASGIVQEALNQLGLLYSERRDAEKSLDYLLEAEILYKKYCETVGGAPWMVNDVFCSESYDEAEVEEIVRKRCDKFEDAYTHTLYYLAQVYAKLEENEKSANYCQETLRRQLERNKYQPIEWSMNAATLSQYYSTISNYKLSQHCLASAELVLKESGERPVNLGIELNNEEGQSDVNEKERIPKAWADLYRCWTKYGLSLLEFSRDRLFQKLEEENKKLNSIDQKDDATTTQVNVENGDKNKENEEFFFNLELTSVENQITDSPICIFEEARLVFLRVQSWLNSAKEFYALDGHCTDYIELVRDHSQLFKLLVFFELDLNRQCKMHKRRADMLAAVLKQLNPQFYLLVCRQLMFELAETYSSMLDNKIALAEANEAGPADHIWKKVNLLAQQSIDQFQAYINSFKTPDGKLPDQFADDDDERPILIAHFYCGRLHSKFIEFKPEVLLKNVKNSLDCYNFLVDYCQRNPSATPKVKSERDVCAEMVTLLPAKMDKIRAQIV